MTSESYRIHVIMDKLPNTIEPKTKKDPSERQATALPLRGGQLFSRFLGKESIHKASFIFIWMKQWKESKATSRLKKLTFETGGS